MDALIQIAINPGRIREALDALTTERPVEIEEFVAALSRMFGRIGMHEICSKCFAGKPLRDRKVRTFGLYFDRKLRCYTTAGWHTRLATHYPRDRGHGCCGPCSLLGQRSCIKKPIGCATYFCGYTGDIFWRSKEFVNWLRDVLGRAGVYSGGCYPEAVVAERRDRYDPDKLKLFRVLRHAVDAWEELAC